MERNDLWFFFAALSGAILLVAGLMNWTTEPAQAQCAKR